MSAMAIGWVVFVLVFGSAMIAMALHGVVPEHHLSTDSKDVVKLGIAVIATMSALVLSLLIASAKGSYDTRSREFTQMTANIILLDRLLAHYGPETKQVRDMFHRSVVDALDRIWSSKNFQVPILAPRAATAQSIYSQIQQLSPQNEAQRSLQGDALKTAVELSQMRWLLFEQRAESPIPMPFLVVLVFWLSIIFASFGLYAPRNATVVATLCVCALSISGAIFLILDLDRPFEGFIRTSSAPLQNAIAQLGQQILLLDLA
jgi:hypothetical protein